MGGKVGIEPAKSIRGVVVSVFLAVLVVKKDPQANTRYHNHL